MTRSALRCGKSRSSVPFPAVGAHIADCRIFGKVPPRFPERKAPPGDGAKFRIKIAKLSSLSRLMAGKFCTGLDRCQPRGLSFSCCVTAGTAPNQAAKRRVVGWSSASFPPLTRCRWQVPARRLTPAGRGAWMIPLTRTVSASTDREPVRDASRMR